MVPNFTYFLNQCEKFRSNMINKRLGNVELSIEFGSLIELCAMINSVRNDNECTRFLISSFHASTYNLKCVFLLVMNLDIFAVCYDSNYEPQVCVIYDNIVEHFNHFKMSSLHTEMTPQLLDLYKETLEVYGRQPTLYNTEILNMTSFISLYKHPANYGEESLKTLSYTIASIFEKYTLRSVTTIYIDTDVVLPILKSVSSDNIVQRETVKTIMTKLYELDELDLTREEWNDCANMIWDVLKSSNYEAKATNLCTRVLNNINVLSEPLIEQTVLGALYIKFKLYGGYQICI